MPPNFRTLEGQIIGQSPIQAWLWECWQKMSEWKHGILGDDPHALVFNGDMIEGIHHRDTQVISADVSDHVDAGIDLVKPHVKEASKTFFVKGTSCHVGNSEIIFGKALLEKGYRVEMNEETKLPAWDKLFIDVAGVRCMFQHHITTTVRPWTEATGLAAQLASETIEAVNNDEPVPRVICCAHRHKFGQFSNGRQLAIVSPPWQMLTRYGHKVVGHARTKPGAYILDWRGVEDGSLPKVHEILFNAPHPKAITL